MVLDRRQGLVGVVGALSSAAAVAAGAYLCVQNLQRQIHFSVGSQLKISNVKIDFAEPTYREIQTPQITTIKVKSPQFAKEVTPLHQKKQNVRAPIQVVSEEDLLELDELDQDRAALALVIQKAFRPEMLQAPKFDLKQKLQIKKTVQPLAKKVDIQKRVLVKKFEKPPEAVTIQPQILNSHIEPMQASAPSSAIQKNSEFHEVKEKFGYTDLLAMMNATPEVAAPPVATTELDGANPSTAPPRQTSITQTASDADQPKVSPLKLDNQEGVQYDDIRHEDPVDTQGAEEVDTQSDVQQVSNQIPINGNHGYSQQIQPQEQMGGLQLLGAPFSFQQAAAPKAAAPIVAVPVNSQPQTSATSPQKTEPMKHEQEKQDVAQSSGLAELASALGEDLKKSNEQSNEVLNSDEVVSPVNQHSFTGKVLEAFTGGQKPLADVTVQILGTDVVTKTNYKGEFEFKDVKVSGVLPVVLSKASYLMRRVDLKEGKPYYVELISQNSAQLSAVASKDRYVEGYAFAFGQVSDPSGQSVDSYQISIQGPSTVAPIYLNEQGTPDANLHMTSSKGQFLLLNLTPGTYLINFIDMFGRERAPHLLHVASGEGVVRKFSVGEKRYVRGKLLNAAYQGNSIEGAQVRLLGSSMIAQSNKRGNFILGPVYIDCDDLNYLQVEKDGYYRNRIDYACSNQRQRTNVYVFSAGYVDSLAIDSGSKLKKGTGVVLGHTSFKESVKAQLWGADEINPNTENTLGVDYYFENDGVLKALLNRTEKNGNFVILEVPGGCSYMQMYNKDDRTLSFWPIYTSPDTVNVYIQ